MPEADAEEFEAAAARYRRELLAHCYQMTRSAQEAEDIVQDTYVHASETHLPVRRPGAVPRLDLPLVLPSR